MATTRRPGGTPKNPRRAVPSRAGSSTSARAPATRPAAAARGRRPSHDRPPPRSVRRIGILASILVMLAITLIPALRSTINQHSQISGLRDRIAEQREQVAALQAEQKKWDDPAYVEQQARERLKFVRVGEKSYTVIDGEAAAEPDLTGGAQMAAPTGASAASIPWYGQLWQSVLIADTPSETATGQSSPAPEKTRGTR